jgi:hypothetical protein
MRDVFGIDNPTLDALASEEDDNRLVARFKAAAVNAPVGFAADALMEAGLRGVRAYRAWRGSLRGSRCGREGGPRGDAGQGPSAEKPSQRKPKRRRRKQRGKSEFDPFKHTKPGDGR